MPSPTPGPRSEIRRLPERGRYDAESVHAILDEGLICHLGFVVDGQPFVIPTTYARDGSRLLLHGSPASRMLRGLAKGIPVCATVTLLDGLVLARSAFHHSMNYRSVVVFGTAREITDLDARRRALDRVVEHIVPGRTRDARGPNDFELKYTKVLALEIEEASVKARDGGPKDDEEDLALPIWAGVIPLKPVPGAPIDDGAHPPGVPAPDYVKGYRRA
ncbi:MAG: pyridoxamine 5'-phosphate oxidase family protein [Myxococcota bacterium]|nr:pyridoxamine 5'-phosphate oxidase family protein [Myxococcota bacterium]